MPRCEWQLYQMARESGTLLARKNLRHPRPVWEYLQLASLFSELA